MKFKLLILSAFVAFACISCGQTESQKNEGNTVTESSADEEFSENANIPKNVDEVNTVDEEATKKGNTPYYKVTVKEYDKDGECHEYTDVSNCFDNILSSDKLMYTEYEYKYNSDGLILEKNMKDSATKTTYEYDEYGNLSRRVYDSNSKAGGMRIERIENEYDTSGNLIKRTVFTSFVHDGETEEENGVVQTYKYDENGNLVEESDEDYGKSTYTYDDRGNMIAREDHHFGERYVMEYNSRDFPETKELFKDGELMARWEYEYEFYD